VNEQHMSRTIDYIVDPDYLRVMGIPLKRGRFLSPTDDEHAPLVVVVDEVFARKFFPGQDPIGKRIHLVYNSDKSAEIVGIVGHAKQWGLDADESQSLRAEYYLACMQVSDGFMALIRTGTGLVIRYDGSLAAILSSIRRVNKEMSGEQVIYGEQTMDSVVTDSMATRRFAMILLGTFAGLALVLACIGIYSVMAYLVGQRTREIGIRMALGAQQGDVAWLVLRRGAGLTMTGAGIGIGATLALTPLMRSLLFDVSPFDPVILGCGGLLLAGVGLAACLIPARRAMRIEPTRALRAE
jgi:predicted permease